MSVENTFESKSEPVGGFSSALIQCIAATKIQDNTLHVTYAASSE